MSLDDELERRQADGRITTGDADEVRHFAGFLEALAAAGIPGGHRNRTDEQDQAFVRIYAEHYPQDYARAVAEERARRAAHADTDERLRYGAETTSPASPGGPAQEGGPDT